MDLSGAAPASEGEIQRGWNAMRPVAHLWAATVYIWHREYEGEWPLPREDAFVSRVLGGARAIGALAVDKGLVEGGELAAIPDRPWFPAVGFVLDSFTEEEGKLLESYRAK
jgi:hypothetical protein